MSTGIQIQGPRGPEIENHHVQAKSGTEFKVGNESSGGSGSEDEGEDGEKLAVILSRVLDEIRDEKLDLTDNKKFATFITDQGPKLASYPGERDQPTALHIIAKERKKIIPSLEPLVRFLCKQGDLESKDLLGRTSLFLAVEQKKESMVRWMCDAYSDISHIISISGSKGMNCLHIGIKKRIKFLEVLIKNAKPEAIAAKDDDGNAPLHLAANYDNCKRQHLEYVRMMIEKGDRAISANSDNDFNKSNLSPYLYHKESVREGRRKAKEATEKPSKDTESAPNLVIPPSTPHSISTGPSIRPDMRENLQVDHRTKYGGGNSVQDQRRGSLAPSIAPAATSDNRLTAESSSSKPNKSKKNKELNFDLFGIIAPGETLTQTGLKNLTRKIAFEYTLQYVCIPKITVESPPSRQKLTVSRPDGAGRRDLVHIFDKLREKHVETILRVIVDDSAYPSHSDEAIEKALKDMSVEVWQWNKPDLCTEVILQAAPSAREVHLYWSGNNAVLRGWSEKGGLPMLPKLQVVHLHPQQGLESRDRMEDNITEFETRMKELCSDVTIIRADCADDYKRRNDKTTARVEETIEQGTKHEWIRCMKVFRRLLFDAERNYEGPNVNQSIEQSIEQGIEQSKVAIIDDGVDMEDLNYHFIGGKSFCIRSEDQGLVDPYYMSRTGHGTIMTKEIEFMCPQAHFFVLRLEDVPSDDETRLNITARSAAKAIRAAILKGVQIISMSWTIDPPKDEKERQDLDSAVVEAANANILLFCSARAKGANSASTYPSKATPKIFTIGAANKSGPSLDYVGDAAQLSYTFPGDKVEVDDGPTKTTSQTVDGSSVATALAAGLAALILYCVQVRIFLAKDSEKQKAREYYKKVKQYDGMKRAFSAIDTTEESGHKFLRVWEVFGKQVEQKEHVKDQGEYLELVAEVGARLCSKIF
ncbi:intracellular serine protease [Fusarium beomiforme]|uniref:Intracellular serine protease n=1 Tax=Fusarium beomiforme TaxID=44412 RepID=A0A9P5AW89_9HYPO|nr:intracellular serine protease [Fusarium beomiforme]